MANAEADAENEAPERRSGKKGLLIGLVLSIFLGGGGFYAVWSGLVLAPEDSASIEPAPPTLDALPDIAFVPLDPIIVSLSAASKSSHLRFRAHLEVAGQYQEDVKRLLPRVTDVLNSYLRAIEPSVLEDRGALTRLRSQMLRRAQIVTGEGRVRDLLIMEFVLS